MPNYAKKPMLSGCDEEYAMLIEVSEEFQKQKIDQIGLMSSSAGIFPCCQGLLILVFPLN